MRGRHTDREIKADFSRTSKISHDSLRSACARPARIRVVSVCVRFRGAAGGTAGHLGTAWGRNKLSHNWESVHPWASKPEASSPNVIKAIIVVTDGVFITSFAGGVLNTGVGSYNPASSAMFQTICGSMRILTISPALALSGARARGPRIMRDVLRLRELDLARYRGEPLHRR